MRSLRSSFLISFTVVLALGLALFLTVSVRSGSLTGLRLRVSTALGAHRTPAEALLRPAGTPVLDEGVWWDPSLIPPSATPRPPTATATEPPPATNTPTKVAAATPMPLAVLPTATATLVPPTPAPLFAPVSQSSLALSGIRHQWQTWNNCGPATLSMNLSYFGSALDQAAIGAALRQSPDDKNVSPDELAAYARAQGMGVVQGVNGSTALLKTLLGNGYPVLVETWLEEEPNDGMGHYRLVTGYDDTQQAWIAYDSYVSSNLVLGGGKHEGGGADYAGIWMPYAETDALWKVFNRAYVLVYPPESEAQIAAILGADWETAAMWQRAREQAQAEINANPVDAFAWFNLGSSELELGDPAAAAIAYDRARAIGLPWRMLWYQFGPFESYHAMGRPQDMIQLADATLANTTSIEEIWYWKGRALAALGDSAAAQSAWTRAVELNPTFAPALDALSTS